MKSTVLVMVAAGMFIAGPVAAQSAADLVKSKNCMGCHAADYMRYNRIGRDLGMSDEEVMAMISTRDAKGDHAKPGELMKIAMDTCFNGADFSLMHFTKALHYIVFHCQHFFGKLLCFIIEFVK